MTYWQKSRESENESETEILIKLTDKEGHCFENA